MNRQVILMNLKEAAEELATTITDLEGESDYTEEDFRVAMVHAFHHLNTAWNARNASDEQWRAQSQDDFKRWERFSPELRRY